MSSPNMNSEYEEIFADKKLLCLLHLILFLVKIQAGMRYKSNWKLKEKRFTQKNICSVKIVLCKITMLPF